MFVAGTLGPPAALTCPSPLPSESTGTGGCSSMPARGVTNLASRMLSALIPLNDLPFFQFEVKTGEQLDPKIGAFLDVIANQVYTKIIGGNFRESVFTALQHLIITGERKLLVLRGASGVF